MPADSTLQIRARTPTTLYPVVEGFRRRTNRSCCGCVSASVVLAVSPHPAGGPAATLSLPPSRVYPELPIRDARSAQPDLMWPNTHTRELLQYSPKSKNNTISSQRWRCMVMVVCGVGGVWWRCVFGGGSGGDGRRPVGTWA